MMKMQGDNFPNSATSSDKDGSITNPTTSFINEDEEESVSTNINKSTDNGEKSADPINLLKIVIPRGILQKQKMKMELKEWNYL